MTIGGKPRLIRRNPKKTTRYGRNKALTSGVDMILTVFQEGKPVGKIKVEKVDRESIKDRYKIMKVCL